MGRADAVMHKALAAYRKGQLADAVRCLRVAVDLQPDQAQALRLLGAIALQQQRPDEAVRWLERAVMSSLEVARDPQIHAALGNLHAAAQRWGEAEPAYATACALRPGDAVIQHNHGVALQELDRADAARAAFERALALEPRYASAHHGRGLALLAGDAAALPDALAAFGAAVACDAANPRYRTERARALICAARHADALEDLAALAAPGADALNLRGIALKALGRADEALAAYDAALAAAPDFAEALSNRGNLRLLARQFAPALADLGRAVALKPGIDWLAGTYLYAGLHVFDWRDHDARRTALLAALDAGRRSVQPLALQCLVDDPARQRLAAQRWTASLGLPAPAPCAPTAATGTADAARIRITYISRDLREHPLAYLIAEVLELHDRARFEVSVLHYGPAEAQGIQARLRAAVERFVDVAALPDAEIAALARRLGSDVAVDLTGFTEGARSGVFAARAAPVQMSYLGYLGTAGGGATPLHDYLIADAVLIPAAERAHYDEAIVYLPSYQANDRQRPRPAPTPRAALGLPEQACVLCCFNNPCKIAPEQFADWVEILHAVPGAVLWLLGEDELASRQLRAHAQALGVAPERLVFAPRRSRDAYLASLGAADLFLDTLPYNAGTTASDALWVGLPVLTRPGRSFSARVAASLLTALDLPELIAPTRADYVERAIALARDPAARAALRAKLAAQRDAGRLFDAPRVARSLEQACREALRLHADGAAPRDIVVID
ncbi:MAG: tetratricopeptide repeat protein [Pelomonas sp.]|nr:tetratricopeptide repeat protein [Roseateles sp.]